MVRRAPRLLDRKKDSIDIRIGNGSKVKVQYKEWESVYRGQTFKGLDFMAMQVLALVEYNGGGGDEFDIEDDDNDNDNEELTEL